jgi:hypothetical protein
VLFQFLEQASDIGVSEAREKITWDASEAGKIVSPQEMQQEIATLRSGRDRWYLGSIIGAILGTAGVALACIMKCWLERH